MADVKEGRILVPEEKLREKVLEGARAAYDAAATSYGPKGKNVILEKGFGRPIFTRDGITILRDVFFSDRAKNFGAQIIIEASETSNRIAGDGSTAVALLAYHLYNNAVKAVAAGQHPMDVSAQLTADSFVLLDELKKKVVAVKDEQLKDVASVSAGDPLIGELIADAILYVGQDGGILTEKAPISEIEREYVDGYYLQSGFTALQAGKKELVDPFVIVSSKRLTSNADAVDILNAIADLKLNPQQRQIPRILFVGNIEDAAYNTIVNTLNQGQIDAIIVKTPPMYGELGKYLLEDIATYANCLPITESTSLKQISDEYIGTIDKVVANKNETTLFADNETQAVIDRIAKIKDQIKTEDVPAVAEKLKDRVAKLEGKIAIFKIGAPTDSTREELEFRIEDAINSTRHAYAEGIVPGGGVTLLELSKLDEISDITREALHSTFKQLLINANTNHVSYRRWWQFYKPIMSVNINEVLQAPIGYGYNLKKSDKLVDVIKDGVVDPYVVVREVITHASGVAAETIKVGLGVIFENTEK